MLGHNQRSEKMADHHGTPTHPKAKKEHRCIYCGGPILVGEQYVQQEGFYDGARSLCAPSAWR